MSETAPLIGYHIPARIIAAWLQRWPGLVARHHEMNSYGTMYSVGSGRPDVDCRQYLAELAAKPIPAKGSEILRSYADFVDSAHELTRCGFRDNGPMIEQWLEHQMALGGIFILNKLEGIGVPHADALEAAELFRDIMRERAEMIVATMHDAPDRLQ